VSDTHGDGASTGYCWFVVAAVSLLQIGSYIDRQVITLLVEPMRRDFGIGDTEVSLLLGFAFAVFYAVMAIPAGRLADRYSRVRLIVVSVIFWTLATLWCMVAEGYRGLFIARMLVGLGEAALIPAGFSLLSDYFRPGRLGLATSTVTGASFLGSGVALAAGGFIISRLPGTEFVTLPIVGEIRSWQLAFGFASIPSVVFLTLFLFVREPARSGQLAQDAGGRSMFDALKYLRKDWAMWTSVFLGMAMIGAFQYGLTAWVPTFFIRSYGWNTAEIGQLYGAVFLICGTSGTVTGGWLCDRLFKSFGRRTFVITPLLSASLSVPLVLVFALGGSGTVSAVMLVPLTFVGTMAFGAAIASIPSLAPNQIRGQLVAVYMLFSTIIGQGCGPWVIAVFTEYVMGDPQALNVSLGVVGASLLALASLILWGGARAISSSPVSAAQPG
jgi:MFS family permease